MTSAFHLQRKQMLCDTVIRTTDGVEIMAHSVILAASSPHLASLLGNVKTHPKVINLAFSSEAILPVVSFIYTGKMFSPPLENVKLSLVSELLDLVSELNITPLIKWLTETERTDDTVHSINGYSFEIQNDIGNWSDGSDKSVALLVKMEPDENILIDDNISYHNEVSQECNQGGMTNMMKVDESKNDKVQSSRQKKHIVKKYQCTFCNKMLSSRRSLKTHAKIHTGTHNQLVGQSLQATSGVQGHEQEPTLFSCSECDLSFKRSSHLRRHRQNIHKIDPTVYPCSLCKRSFCQESTLKTHMEKHANPKEYKCEQCTMVFKQPRTLREHLSIHNGLTTYVCDVCGGNYRNNFKLRQHKRTHETDRQKEYQCAYCAKLFLTKRGMQSHESSHNNPKTFKCKYCPKGFHQKANCITHELIHTGEKPCICEVCGKSFRKSYHLKRHRTTHSSEKPFKCTECGRRFKHQDILQRHIAIHNENLSIHCSTCGKSFLTTYRLKLHNRSHQGLKPYSCRFCDRSFTKNQAKKSHEFKVHGHKNIPNTCTKTSVTQYLTEKRLSTESKESIIGQDVTSVLL